MSAAQHDPADRGDRHPGGVGGGGVPPRRGRCSSNAGPSTPSKPSPRCSTTEPEAASVHLLAARAYLASAQFRRAEEGFLRVLELDPADHYARFALGRTLQRQSRLAEARTQLRMAAAMDPRPEYQEALGEVSANIAVRVRPARAAARPPRPSAARRRRRSRRRRRRGGRTRRSCCTTAPRRASPGRWRGRGRRRRGSGPAARAASSMLFGSATPSPLPSERHFAHVDGMNCSGPTARSSAESPSRTPPSVSPMVRLPPVPSRGTPTMRGVTSPLSAICGAAVAPVVGLDAREPRDRDPREVAVRLLRASPRGRRAP